MGDNSPRSAGWIKTKRSSYFSTVSPFISVEKAVEHSSELWARDLQGLFDHARERFGDVTWETESGEDRIWGHKAIIYARAPKAFKDRYFLTRPFSRSPTLRSPSASSAHLLPPLFPSQPGSTSSSATPSLRNHSSLSVRTWYSDVTVRRGSSGSTSSDGVMRLTHGDTPELFQAQLEWLYTGEGFGDVVEWMEEDDGNGETGSSGVEVVSVRDSLGRRGSKAERQDKLGQDLTYMWRSKLYVDVRIHLDTSISSATALIPGTEESDSDSSTDSLSSTAVFTAHRFVLVSRSPYFSSLLLNTSSFLSPTLSASGTTDVHLPTPPFTPASLHFCLGYIYAGHLDFSNRSFDLTTAFQIYRAAAYLQMDSLVQEVKARIVWDFCHGLDWTRCRCRKCALRAARVWTFAREDDVGDRQLAEAARRYLVVGWSESWGREVGLLSLEDQAELVQAVKGDISSRTVISTYKAIKHLRERMDSAVRSRGSSAAEWIGGLEKMIDEVSEQARKVLLDEFGSIAEGQELWDLISGKGFSEDLLEVIMKDLVESVGSATGCIEGPRVYQILVSSILLKTHPDTLQTLIPPRSRSRQIVESAREGVVAHIRRRWMQIRDAGGFQGLEIWALGEIADEIEVSDEDLLMLSNSPVPRRTTPKAVRTGIPRTTSHAVSVSQTSLRSSIASSSRVPLSPTRRETVNTSTAAVPEAGGLRRLRLSSSASTNSAVSTRSARTRETSPLIQNVTGPQPRSPTAAKPGNRVNIGSARRAEVDHRERNRAESPTPTQSTSRSVVGLKREPMSGGIRPLVARGSVAGVKATSDGIKGKGKEELELEGKGSSTVILEKEGEMERPVSPKPTPSVAPTRTTRTAKSTVTPRPPESSVRAKTPASVAATSAARPKSATPSVSSTRTPRTSTSRSTLPPVPTNSAAPPIPKRTLGTSQRTPVTVDPSARTRLLSAASTTSRVRTESASTTASVRSKATSFASTLRGAPPVPSASTLMPSSRSRTGGMTPSTSASSVSRSTTIGKTSTASTASTARPSGLSPQKVKPRLGQKAVPTAFPAHPANPGLRVPYRSGSSSTAEDPEARTPRSSETGDPVVRLPSETYDESDARYSSPGLPAEKHTEKLPPPVMPRTARTVSTASARSTTASIRPSHPAAAFDPPKKLAPPPILRQMSISDGSVPFKGRGVSLRVGIPCIVSLEGRRARFRAQVKYIGYLNNTKGPWVGIEAEDLDRFGVMTFPAGSKDGVHYFHLSQDDPLHTGLASGGQAEIDAETDIRSNRQRKIELIREGIKKPKYHGLGLGISQLGPTLSMNAGEGRMGIWAESAGIKRSTSPFLGHSGLGAVAGGGGGEWVGGMKSVGRLRALFVRPSEVVYVVGAE